MSNPTARKSVRVVAEFNDCQNPKEQALHFSIALAERGHQSEVVEIVGSRGWRVVTEDEGAVKMIDFYPRETSYEKQTVCTRCGAVIAKNQRSYFMGVCRDCYEECGS